MLLHGWLLMLAPLLWDYVLVSESSRSDRAGTMLSTGMHAGLTQVRQRRLTSCTYLCLEGSLLASWCYSMPRT